MAIKVFVSSTYIDLKDHRQRVITQLRRAGYHVDPMEDWTSDANEPRRFSLDRLDGCQACVLLVGFRRGFVPAGQERSITQMEYDYAIAHGINVLPFLLDDRVIGWPDHYDDRTKDPLLQEWRESLGLRHGVERFTTDPTSVDVLPALSRWKDRHYAREQLETAGLTPATQLQFHDLTVGGHIPPRGGTIQPSGGDTRRSDPDSRNRRAMIEKVWAIWITGVLQPSLPQDILLELGLTERPAVVTRALDLLVQPDLADRVQAPGTPLVDVFDRLDRALLVLGAPGAGKTTLLLTLARDLLQRAAQDPEQPIPVVFPLSSWAAQRRPLAAWLADELQQRYDVPRKTGQAWVDADQVLPLLDGLDEVQAEHRAACAEAINTFRQDHGLLPLAVCSRIAEYEGLGAPLRLQGAIVVQPLTRAQVDGYLTQVGQPLAAVHATLQEDPLLWELLDTPLMLTMVTLAYAGLPAEALCMRGTLVARRQSLFAVYVNRMFQRRSAVTPYTRLQAERWLAWLAWQMTQHGQTDFYLERLQPDWLPIWRRWLPTQGARLLAGLVGGLLAGLVSGLLTGLIYGLRNGLMNGILVAFIGAFIGGLTGYSQEITPIETVRWSWPKFLSELLLPLQLLQPSHRGLRGGLLAELGVGLFFWPVSWLVIGLLFGQEIELGAGLALLVFLLPIWLGAVLPIWLGAGLAVGLSAGLASGLVIELGAGLGAGPVAGLARWLGTWLDDELVAELVPALVPALLIGLSVGLVYKLSTALAAGLSGGEISAKTVPNEGIHRSARMAESIGLSTGLLLAGLRYELLGGLFGGPLIGLAIGLRYGGRACLQHLVLRLALRYHGSISRRYADFLDYAAERLFLRKVGGGYIFIHRLLQEYFAALYRPNRGDSPPQAPPPPPC